MASTSLPGYELLEVLHADGDLDDIREALALVLQVLIEAEAAQQIGASRYQRTKTRTSHRNGACTPATVHKGGDVVLRISRPGEGSCFSGTVGATPPHRSGVGDGGGLLQGGLHPQGGRPGQGPGVGSGLSESEVARICAELDAWVVAS